MIRGLDLVLAILSVGFFGGLGSVVRQFASNLSGVLPWGILAANSVASFIAGAAISNEFYQLALVVGLAGGLSTFSTFAAQSYELWAAGHRARALVNGTLNLMFPAVSFLTASLLL